MSEKVISEEKFLRLAKSIGISESEIKEMFDALNEFKQKNPWAGDIKERKEKFRELHEKFNKIFNKNIELTFLIPENIRDWEPSGASFYDKFYKIIAIRGRLSVITFIHEWLHVFTDSQEISRDLSEYIFAKIFPEKWEKLYRDESGIMRVKK